MLSSLKTKPHLRDGCSPCPGLAKVPMARLFRLPRKNRSTDNHMGRKATKRCHELDSICRGRTFLSVHSLQPDPSPLHGVGSPVSECPAPSVHSVMSTSGSLVPRCRLRHKTLCVDAFGSCPCHSSSPCLGASAASCVGSRAVCRHRPLLVS